MPIASLPEIMDRAFQKRYGVAAFNTVDDITMHGVIKAAEQSRSPLDHSNLRQDGEVLGRQCRQGHVYRHGHHAPRCRSRCIWITAPIPRWPKPASKVGWNSVLFDGSGLSFDENFQVTREIVKFADGLGASVEGEVVGGRRR